MDIGMYCASQPSSPKQGSTVVVAGYSIEKVISKLTGGYLHILQITVMYLHIFFPEHISSAGCSLIINK